MTIGDSPVEVRRIFVCEESVSVVECLGGVGFLLPLLCEVFGGCGTLFGVFFPLLCCVVVFVFVFAECRPRGLDGELHSSRSPGSGFLFRSLES